MQDALSRHTVHASLLQGMLRVQPDMAVASSSGEKLELQPISKQVGMNPRCVCTHSSVYVVAKVIALCPIVLALDLLALPLLATIA